MATPNLLRGLSRNGSMVSGFALGIREHQYKSAAEHGFIAEPEFMYPRTPGLIPQSGTKGPFLLPSTVPKRRHIPQSGTTVLDTATLVPL
jgi:hypothetical protein